MWPEARVEADIHIRSDQIWWGFFVSHPKFMIIDFLIGVTDLS